VIIAEQRDDQLVRAVVSRRNDLMADDGIPASNAKNAAVDWLMDPLLTLGTNPAQLSFGQKQETGVNDGLIIDYQLRLVDHLDQIATVTQHLTCVVGEFEILAGQL